MRFRIPVYLGLVVQDGIQQRVVNFDFSVVADEAKLAELVHEEAHARPGRTDHFSQCFLADVGADKLWAAILAKIRQQKQQASQPFLARVKELIDQIFFDPAISGQQICHEHLRKLRFAVKRRKHGRFRDRRNQAFFHRRRRRDAQRVTVHAAFAKELAGLQNPDDRFLALLGYDDNLDPAFLNIENRVRDVSLGEDDLVLAIFQYRFPSPTLARNTLGSNED